MKRPSRRSALVAALAMLAPSLAAGLLAVHVTHGHHDDVAATQDLAIVLHGHAHSQDAAPHAHTLTLTAAAGHARPHPLAHTPLFACVRQSGESHLPLLTVPAPRPRSDHGPPFAPGGFAVLRV